MKKRIILLALITTCLTICLALGVNASSTNEFGTPETNTTIDLTGMSTDANARVVLFDGEEYHTYPARYIVTNAKTLTFDTSKINEVFGKEYNITSDKTNNDCIIRIEIPNTVEIIPSGPFNYGDNKSLVEVVFPSDSTCKEFNWGCFEGNTALQKINIPASLEKFNGTNHFAKCSSLKQLTFDEGFSISEIPANFMQSCSSLEKIIFPNSVTKINGGAFASCSKLEKIVFGDSLQVMGGPMSDCATGGSVWYLPKTFYAESVADNPPSNMFHWAGTQTNGVSGNSNNPKNITFVYTGTREQALALQARCKAADEAKGENCVGLSRIYNAVLCTEAEYVELTGKNIGEIATGYYLVYGYSDCDAFYNGNHEMKEKYVFEAFDKNTYKAGVCSRCFEEHITESYGPIVVISGASHSDNDIMYNYSVNKTAIEVYLANGRTLSFGVVVAIGNVTSPLNADGTLAEGTSGYASNLTDRGNDLYEIAVKGIPAEHLATSIVCCGYICDGENVYYMGETALGEAATPVTLEALIALTPAEIKEEY